MLELLLELVPQARLIVLLVDPSIPRETEAASPAKGVETADAESAPRPARAAKSGSAAKPGSAVKPESATKSAPPHS